MMAATKGVDRQDCKDIQGLECPGAGTVKMEVCVPAKMERMNQPAAPAASKFPRTARSRDKEQGIFFLAHLRKEFA